MTVAFAAKAAKATVIKSAADEAVKTAEAAAQAKEEAAAKAAKVIEAAAKEITRLEIVHKGKSSTPGPFFASFMVWLGDLTSKLCKANKKVAEEMPRQQLPEQLIGA